MSFKVQSMTHTHTSPSFLRKTIMMSSEETATIAGQVACLTPSTKRSSALWTSSRHPSEASLRHKSRKIWPPKPQQATITSSARKSTPMTLSPTMWQQDLKSTLPTKMTSSTRIGRSKCLQQTIEALHKTKVKPRQTVLTIRI